MLRLQHAQPEVDVEDVLRVRVSRLLRGAPIARSAHLGGEKRKHGSMDDGRIGHVQSVGRERRGEGVFFATRMEFERTR